MIENILEKRRSLRALEPQPLSESDIEIIKKSATLAPSCFNNQPWRYIFVRNNLNELFKALNKGNEWAKNASLIIAVFSKKEYDCIIDKREYYLFDTGISVGFIIAQLTDLGYVAHPIAGYNEEKAKKILGIPDDFTLIALIVVGKHNPQKTEFLNENQIKIENIRPERKSEREIFYDEKYN